MLTQKPNPNLKRKFEVGLCGTNTLTSDWVLEPINLRSLLPHSPGTAKDNYFTCHFAKDRPLYDYARVDCWEIGALYLTENA
jgi:hypothetical protein